MGSHSRHKNKGKNRKIDRVKRGMSGNKLGRRLMSNATRQSTSKVDRKLMTFRMDRNDRFDNDLVVSPHEADRVEAKMLEERRTNREGRPEQPATPAMLAPSTDRPTNNEPIKVIDDQRYDPSRPE